MLIVQEVLDDVEDIDVSTVPAADDVAESQKLFEPAAVVGEDFLRGLWPVPYAHSTRH